MASDGPHRVRRVLYADDPTPADLLAAEEEVKVIRRELARLRSRLNEVGKLEAILPHDSLADDVASALSVALVALYTLEAGDRSLGRRAEKLDDLLTDAREHPDSYVIEPGMSPGRQKRGRGFRAAA